MVRALMVWLEFYPNDLNLSGFTDNTLNVFIGCPGWVVKPGSLGFPYIFHFSFNTSDDPRTPKKFQNDGFKNETLFFHSITFQVPEKGPVGLYVIESREFL
jgi:hypothetical protein